MRVLAVDVGGRHVKALDQGETERRRFKSDADLTPDRMVEGVLDVVDDWDFDRVSIGAPSPRRDVVLPDPVNLGNAGRLRPRPPGRADEVVNDPVMHASGSATSVADARPRAGTGTGRP